MQNTIATELATTGSFTQWMMNWCKSLLWQLLIAVRRMNHEDKVDGYGLLAAHCKGATNTSLPDGHVESGEKDLDCCTFITCNRDLDYKHI
jgi:hypothetical protein